MSGARPLHELYGTTNRRRHFPEVGWHHLVLAARNTAAAFQTLHSAGIIVGDVNQGNLLVDKQMCVRMIDCDSFQITSNGRTFHCPVGTPHFTPPELQSKKLREVVRTANNDRFGLAVLIFHLLFVGRHPFAGRYRGPGDLPIEKAIAERRFAFSKHQSETLVEPPPASLLLEDLPGTVAELFECAFRAPDGDDHERPSPVEWVQQLESLMKQRRACSFDPMHVYFAQLSSCPWCRIEDAGGPAFFVAASGLTTVSADRLTALEEQIWDLQEVRFPDLECSSLTLPDMPRIKRLVHPPKKTWPDYAAAALAASCAACLVGVFTNTWVLGAATGSSIALAVALVIGRQARARRKTTHDFTAWLVRNRAALARRAQQIEYGYQQREAAFNRYNQDLKQEIDNFSAAGDKLPDVLAQHREAQKGDFLRCFLIRDNAKSIPGLTASHVTIMESYGVESANDLERIRLYGIPSIEPELVMELLQWRTTVERGFQFNPQHGVTMAELRGAKEAAVRRFKIAQARKILTAGKQLESLVAAAQMELTRVITHFDQLKAAWTDQAKRFRDFQSGRLSIERLINSSPWLIAGLAAGVPALAWLLHLVR
jgi:DNA-binding helix-hairpin-helix protein with protein kinase domain